MNCQFMMCTDDGTEGRVVSKDNMRVSVRVCPQHARFLDNGGTMSMEFESHGPTPTVIMPDTSGSMKLSEEDQRELEQLRDR